MVEVFLRSEPRQRADHKIIEAQTERPAASIAIVARRIEALEIDSIAHHDQLFAAASE